MSEVELLSKEKAKPAFLDFFTDEEIWKIMGQLMSANKDKASIFPSVREMAGQNFSIRDFVETRLGTTFLFSSLCSAFFDSTGFIGFRDQYSEVAERFEEIRSKLSSQPLPKFAKHQEIPKKPSNIILRHRDIVGGVIVTDHAWKRFCERYLKSLNAPFQFDQYSQGNLWLKLDECFRCARRMELSKVDTVLRMLRNREEEAVYYWNRRVNLRFVVSVSEPRTLLTVEIPNR